MDFVANPVEIMSMASAILLLLLNSNRAVDFGLDEDSDDNKTPMLDNIRESQAMASFTSKIYTHAALHTFRLCNIFCMFDVELGYWVKPRSTTWFFGFLMGQNDEERWIKIFHMI